MSDKQEREPLFPIYGDSRNSGIAEGIRLLNVVQRAIRNSLVSVFPTAEEEKIRAAVTAELEHLSDIKLIERGTVDKSNKTYIGWKDLYDSVFDRVRAYIGFQLFGNYVEGPITRTKKFFRFKEGSSKEDVFGRACYLNTPYWKVECDVSITPFRGAEQITINIDINNENRSEDS